MNTQDYDGYIERKKQEHGSKFDPSALSKKFIPFYESGQRIEVKTPWGKLERGYVGVTTGWKPSFLLVHRRNDRGSSTLLSDEYEIVKTLPLFRDSFQWSLS